MPHQNASTMEGTSDGRANRTRRTAPGQYRRFSGFQHFGGGAASPEVAISFDLAIATSGLEGVDAAKSGPGGNAMPGMTRRRRLYHSGARSLPPRRRQRQAVRGGGRVDNRLRSRDMGRALYCFLNYLRIFSTLLLARAIVQLTTDVAAPSHVKNRYAFKIQCDTRTARLCARFGSPAVVFESIDGFNPASRVDRRSQVVQIRRRSPSTFSGLR